MYYIKGENGPLRVRVTAVHPDGVDWVAESGVEGATHYRLPLTDEAGNVVIPEAPKPLDQRIADLEQQLTAERTI